MPSPQTSRTVRLAAAVALGTALFDIAVLAVLHVAQPDVSPVTEPTSSYANGTLGVLSQIATFAVGAGAVALAVALRPYAPHGRARFAWVLLMMFALAKLLQAFFVIDPSGEATVAGAVHNLAGNFAFFLLPIAAVRLGAEVTFETDRPAPKIVAWVLAVATILTLLSVPADLFGVAQRAYLLVADVWVAMTALALLGAERSDAARR